eukprot:jgi/Bigna1/82353/fgenesh1_pg.91_\
MMMMMVVAVVVAAVGLGESRMPHNAERPLRASTTIIQMRRKNTGYECGDEKEGEKGRGGGGGGGSLRLYLHRHIISHCSRQGRCLLGYELSAHLLYNAIAIAAVYGLAGTIRRCLACPRPRAVNSLRLSSHNSTNICHDTMTTMTMIVTVKITGSGVIDDNDGMAEKKRREEYDYNQEDKACPCCRCRVVSATVPYPGSEQAVQARKIKQPPATSIEQANARNRLLDSVAPHNYHFVVVIDVVISNTLPHDGERDRISLRESKTEAERYEEEERVRDAQRARPKRPHNAPEPASTRAAALGLEEHVHVAYPREAEAEQRVRPVARYCVQPFDPTLLRQIRSEICWLSPYPRRRPHPLPRRRVLLPFGFKTLGEAVEAVVKSSDVAPIVNLFRINLPNSVPLADDEPLSLALAALVMFMSIIVYIDSIWVQNPPSEVKGRGSSSATSSSFKTRRREAEEAGATEFDDSEVARASGRERQKPALEAPAPVRRGGEEVRREPLPPLTDSRVLGDSERLKTTRGKIDDNGNEWRGGGEEVRKEPLPPLTDSRVLDDSERLKTTRGKIDDDGGEWRPNMEDLGAETRGIGRYSFLKDTKPMVYTIECQGSALIWWQGSWVNALIKVALKKKIMKMKIRHNEGH